MVQRDDIEREYQRRVKAYRGDPHANCGWAFMFTPESFLTGARVALVGLNPGGDQKDPEPEWDHDGVNAYVDEPWGIDGQLNPLQRQVVFLLQALGVRPDEIVAAINVRSGSPRRPHPFCAPFQAMGEVSGIQVRLDEIFAANFVPFRSPSWDKLPGPDRALAFGRCLWTDLLTCMPAPLFVSIGKQSGQELTKLLHASFTQSHKVDWRRQKIDEYVARDGRTVLAIPHLSRFQIFGPTRPSAASTVRQVAQRVLR